MNVLWIWTIFLFTPQNNREQDLLSRSRLSQPFLFSLRVALLQLGSIPVLQ